jgi:hypothetical protein
MGDHVPAHRSEPPMSPCTILSICLAAGPLSGQAAQGPAVQSEALRPDPGWKGLDRNLWFDPKELRVILRARVVFREGPLEHLMCVKGTKEHEAIVSTDASPRAIHTALLLTGAKEGHPVRFAPKFEPPAGSPIAIEVQWRQDGRLRKADARRWVWDEKAKAPLDIDWVFAGSLIYEDPIDKKPRYAADEGDLIVVSNFASAILDLPMASSADDAGRSFTANTKEIPPIGTEVFLVLRPRQDPPPSKTEKGTKSLPRPPDDPAKSPRRPPDPGATPPR